MAIYFGHNKINTIVFLHARDLIEDYVDTFENQEEAFVAIILEKKISKEISNKLLLKFHECPNIKYSIRGIIRLCNRLNRLYFNKKLSENSSADFINYALAMCGVFHPIDSIRSKNLSECELRDNYRRKLYSMGIRSWPEAKSKYAFNRKIKLFELLNKQDYKTRYFKCRKKKDVYKEIAKFYKLL